MRPSPLWGQLPVIGLVGEGLGGILLERYRLDALLFEGVRQVYLATDLQLGGRCVVKMVEGEYDCARLKREVKLAARCSRIEGLVRFWEYQEDTIDVPA